MSSLIEQAAQRLAQLRQAGVEIPGEDTPPVAATPVPAPAPVVAPAATEPAVAVAERPHSGAPASSATVEPAAPQAAAARLPLPADEPQPISRRVELDLPALTA